MTQPTWLAYSFAVVMVAVSLYCVGWLIAARVRSRQNHMDVNVSHVAMGLAMAGMLVPRLKLLPDGVWEAVFVAIALWFTWQGSPLRRGRGPAIDSPAITHGLSHYLIHLVMALAMLYMYVAAVPASAGGPSTRHDRAHRYGGQFRRPPPAVRGRPVRVGGLAARRAQPVRRAPGPNWSAWASRARHRGRATAPGTSDLVPGFPVAPASPPETVAQPSLAPRLEMGCHIAMCVTMGYMLVLML